MLVFTFALLLAGASGTPPVSKIRIGCEHAMKFGDAKASRRLLLAEVSGSTDAGATAWRLFADFAELKSYSDRSGAPDGQAWVWRDNRNTIIASFMFQSDSGDWSHSVDYCYQGSGELMRIHEKYMSFSENVEVVSDTYFSADGRVLKTRSRAVDLESKKVLRDYQGDRAPKYMRVSDLPFSTILQERGLTAR